MQSHQRVSSRPSTPPPTTENAWEPEHRTPPPTTENAREPEHSTPLSAGSNTNETHRSNSYQRDYAPYLLQDLKVERIVSVEEFCTLILGLGTSNMPQADTPDLDELRDAYCQPVREEEERYYHFCNWVNASLPEGSNYVLCRNDNTYLCGTDAKRKPDTGLVCKATLMENRRRVSVDNLSEKGPTESPFHPAELLSFIEFKLIKKDLLSVKGQVRATKATSGGRRPNRTGAKKAQARNPTPGERKSSRTLHSASQSSPTLAPALPRVLNSMGEVTESPLTQCASYALEMMSHGFRQHVIGFLVTDAEIEFLYYDRSILLRSKPLNFIVNWDMFERIIGHIGRFSLAHWGFHDVISNMEPLQLRRLWEFNTIPTRPIISLFNGCNIQLEGGRTLKLENIVHQTHGLRGRGTLVVKAKVDQGEPFPVTNLVVKLSWPPSGRTSESYLLHRIEQAIGPPDEWVQRHLPKLFCDASIEDKVGIQQRLLKHFPNDYETRILRVQVFEELFPITDLGGEVILGKTFLDLVRCHKWVYDVGRVLHRDISMGNWMYRKSRSGNEVYGVLNDFDLATERDPPNSGPTSLQRTGTRIYMAIELLRRGDPPLHLYRHDLESFFYLLFDIAHNPSNQEVTVASWRNLSMPHLAAIKVALFSTQVSNVLLPEYQAMATCLLRIQLFFRPYLDYRLFGGDQDSETIGGAITGEKFVSLLERHLPGLPVPPPVN